MYLCSNPPRPAEHHRRSVKHGSLLSVSRSPGHSPRKQSTVSSHSPRHSEPPYEGPLHSLVLCMVPFEQEAEQELQLDHSFHTPSTEKRHRIIHKEAEFKKYACACFELLTEHSDNNSSLSTSPPCFQKTTERHRLWSVLCMGCLWIHFAMHCIYVSLFRLLELISLNV